MTPTVTPAGSSEEGGTPEPGEMLQQGIAFNAEDIWNAYEAGTREAYEMWRRGVANEVTFDALVQRSCDAYTKLAHSRKPRAVIDPLMSKIVKTADATGEPLVCEHGVWPRPHVIRCPRSFAFEAQMGGDDAWAIADSVRLALLALHESESEVAVGLLMAVAGPVGRVLRRGRSAPVPPSLPLHRAPTHD